MNGNEIFIIIIGIIFILVCLILLYIMPNAKNCNSCDTHLSIHRHNSYFLKNKISEKLEVCKKCFQAGCFLRDPSGQCDNVTATVNVASTPELNSNILASKIVNSASIFVAPSQTLPPLSIIPKPSEISTIDMLQSLIIDAPLADCLFVDTETTNLEQSTSKSNSNLLASSFFENAPTTIIPSQKLSSPLVFSKLKDEVVINTLQSLIIDTPITDCLFVDTQTTSLERPEIIELCIRDINGIVYHNRFKPHQKISDNAYKVHKISNADLEDAPQYEQEEANILSLLNGKRIVAYNFEFDCKAFLISSRNPALVHEYRELESNGVCIMNAIRFKLKRFKSITLIDACTEFETPLLPAHSAVNDTLMLMDLYVKFRELLKTNPNEWLPSFYDINFYNLNNCERNQPIPFWVSKDNERQALYRPHTSGGRGKIAEAGDNLKHELSQWAGADFMLQNNEEGFPLMQVNFISESQLKLELEQWRETNKEALREQLLNAKPAKNGKLRLTFKEHNYSSRYLGTNFLKADDELYQCKYSMGDTLYLEPITDLDGFNFRSIMFKNKSGENCGQLLNLTQAWTRVFGLLVQGYRAEVLILDNDKKNTKVDVYLFKDEVTH